MDIGQTNKQIDSTFYKRLVKCILKICSAASKGAHVHVHSIHFVFVGGIPIRVYKPRSSRPDPAILVYFHGGGQVLGNVPMYDTCCKMLAE